jgi:hypothetical protein
MEVGEHPCYRGIAAFKLSTVLSVATQEKAGNWLSVQVRYRSVDCPLIATFSREVPLDLSGQGAHLFTPSHSKTLLFNGLQWTARPKTNRA